MSENKPTPGVSRESRVSPEGLERLEQHLRRGANISPMVLEQWIRRYGDAARQLIEQHKKDVGK